MRSQRCGNVLLCCGMKKMPNQTERVVFLCRRVDARPSQSCWHTQFLSVHRGGERHPPGSFSGAIVRWLGAGVQSGPGSGLFCLQPIKTRARLQVLWDPVRDGGNNYITLVLPGWLTLFKSPPWSLSLPSTSSVFFKKALYAASLLVSVLLFAAPTLLRGVRRISV